MSDRRLIPAFLTAQGFGGVALDVEVDETVRFYGNLKNIYLGPRARIDAYSVIVAIGRVVLEEDSHVSTHCGIRSHDVFSLGARSALSAGVQVFGATDEPGGEKFCGRVIVGADCVVGANSVLLPDAIIGHDTFVGACSLVKESLEPRCVYAGAPAKLVRRL